MIVALWWFLTLSIAATIGSFITTGDYGRAIGLCAVLACVLAVRRELKEPA